ncbi:RiPP maturation radical SAM C-methyltransferase [Spirosoma montaniterrae]|uniref:Uncharacterized protein n=1 Tax=Spirosoma montaniterrae TaxID=1178516 RepID=A0A1P9WW85_9BACT|nr:RiPP maturation radical SAM C-methyltransferase [Spirosoma montaniterrae]AQG79578.1 hypothetical protein AWR27_09720 [Spirosoma montaniterrae]
MDKKVLIALMPWASIDFPGLGPTLVHSILNQQGYPCEMMYGNLAYCHFLQGDRFVIEQVSKLPISEIAFSPLYFAVSKQTAADKLERHVEGTSQKGDEKRKSSAYYLNIVEQAENCINYLFESTPWGDYDVVGFSVMMQQTVASLALAKKIKRHYPTIAILFGGPSTSAPMGEAMIRAFPEIDYILQGEVDATIGPFVQELRQEKKDLRQIHGLLYRNNDGTISRTAPNRPFVKLDTLPVPDYGPYFSQLSQYGITNIEPYLQIETSRGCWWGEKHHCTFCGIEDEILKYRTKSDDNVLNEIITLSSKHRGLEFFPVDSIISHGAFNSLLPKLTQLRSEFGYDFSFFFECKSNLSTHHATRFRDAGVRSVQPGIESFSDNILRMMDKGTTGAKQVQCLKLCAEREIVVNWNLIYENIGEREEDYEIMIRLIPFITHLPPLHAEGMIPVQLNRYAPLHNTPERFGIVNIRPKGYYYDIFPDESIDFDNLAFYFDFDRNDKITPKLKALHSQLHDRLEAWRENYQERTLVQRRGPGFIEIIDQRQLAYTGKDRLTVGRIVLEGIEAEMFSACDEVIREDSLVRLFIDRVDEGEIRQFVDRMVACYQIYRSESDQLINLPLRLDIPKRPTGADANEGKNSDYNIALLELR